MQMMYLAICFGYWGRGETEQEAIAQLRKAGGRKSDKTVIYLNERPEGKDKPYVNDCGNTVYYGRLTKIAEIYRGKRRDFAGQVPA